jgi:hypothetical protein
LLPLYAAQPHLTGLCISLCLCYLQFATKSRLCDETGAPLTVQAGNCKYFHSYHTALCLYVRFTIRSRCSCNQYISTLIATTYHRILLQNCWYVSMQYNAVSAGASPIGSPSSKSGRQSCGSPLRKTVHKIHDKKPVLYRVVKKQLLVCTPSALTVIYTT